MESVSKIRRWILVEGRSIRSVARVTGMLTNPRLLRIVDHACNWMYRRVQHIILHSNGFRERLLERGVPPEKMTAIIGWTNEAKADRPAPSPPANMHDLRGLKVLYAGNTRNDILTLARIGPPTSGLHPVGGNAFRVA